MSAKFIESLEARQFLSANPNHAGGFDPAAYGPATYVRDGTTLTLNNAHDVQVDELVAGQITVFDKSMSATVTTVFEGITTLVVNGTRGDDIISAGLDTVNATFHGDRGADFLIISDNGTGSSLIYGDGGNDTIAVSNYNAGTHAYGGTGRDTFYYYVATGPGGVFEQ